VPLEANILEIAVCVVIKKVCFDDETATKLEKLSKYCNNNIIYVLIDSELSQILEIYIIYHSAYSECLYTL